MQDASSLDVIWLKILCILYNIIAILLLNFKRNIVHINAI